MLSDLDYRLDPQCYITRLIEHTPAGLTAIVCKHTQHLNLHASAVAYGIEVTLSDGRQIGVTIELECPIGRTRTTTQGAAVVWLRPYCP